MPLTKKYLRVYAGMTLIELMVSVVILVMLIGAFGIIVTQGQRVVNKGQAIMRNDDAAGALARVFQNDLMRASQNGFLCITQAADGSPQLFVSTAGPTPSLTCSAVGMGAFVGFGLCDQNPPSTDRILWKAAWILIKDNTLAYPDIWSASDFSDIQIMARNTLQNTIIALQGASYAPSTINVAPQNLDDLKGLWKFLAAGCKELSIQWTDGSGIWYGLESGKPYKSKASPPLGNTCDNTEFEYNSHYWALWTHHNQNEWPRAVKFTFTLNGELNELICPIGE